MIKKITLLVLTVFTMMSCEDVIEFNSSTFQGDRNYQFWSADSFSAEITGNNSLIISGVSGSGTVNLILPSRAATIYEVGDGNVAIAEYIDSFGTKFSTDNLPDVSVSIYPELGEIIIENIDIENSGFSGTFQFIAFDESGLNSVGYNNGVFVNVPLKSESD